MRSFELYVEAIGRLDQGEMLEHWHESVESIFRPTQRGCHQ